MEKKQDKERPATESRILKAVDKTGEKALELLEFGMTVIDISPFRKRKPENKKKLQRDFMQPYLYEDQRTIDTLEEAKANIRRIKGNAKELEGYIDSRIVTINIEEGTGYKGGDRKTEMHIGALKASSERALNRLDSAYIDLLSWELSLKKEKEQIKTILDAKEKEAEEKKNEAERLNRETREAYIKISKSYSKRLRRFAGTAVLTAAAGLCLGVPSYLIGDAWKRSFPEDLKKAESRAEALEERIASERAYIAELEDENKELKQENRDYSDKNTGLRSLLAEETEENIEKEKELEKEKIRRKIANKQASELEVKYIEKIDRIRRESRQYSKKMEERVSDLEEELVLMQKNLKEKDKEYLDVKRSYEKYKKEDRKEDASYEDKLSEMEQESELYKKRSAELGAEIASLKKRMDEKTKEYRRDLLAERKENIKIRKEKTNLRKELEDITEKYEAYVAGKGDVAGKRDVAGNTRKSPDPKPEEEDYMKVIRAYIRMHAKD